MHHYPQIFRHRISQIRRTPTSKNREDFSRLPVKSPRASHGKVVSRANERSYTSRSLLIPLPQVTVAGGTNHFFKLIQFGAVRWGFTKGGIVHVSLAEWRSNTVMERTRRVLNSSISKVHPRFIAILTLFLPLSFPVFLLLYPSVFLLLPLYFSFLVRSLATTVRRPMKSQSSIQPRATKLPELKLLSLWRFYGFVVPARELTRSFLLIRRDYLLYPPAFSFFSLVSPYDVPRV